MSDHYAIGEILAGITGIVEDIDMGLGNRNVMPAAVPALG